MNWKIFKFTIAFILLIAFVALAIPQFNFKVGETQIYYPNIDFSLVSSGSKTGNFLRGRGLFPTKEVTSGILFTDTTLSDGAKREALANYLKIIRNRISVAGLKDVEARSQISDNGYEIVVNYPDYYADPIKYTGWLIGKGVISFATFDNSGQTGSIDLTDKNIYGPVSVNFVSQIGSHLQFQFDAAKQSVVTGVLGSTTSSQVGFFLMDVDGKEQFFVRQYEQNDEASVTVRAIPVNYSSTESTDKSIMLAIFRTYFLDKATWKDSFVAGETVTVIPSEFSADTTRFLTLICVLSVAVLILAAFIKLKIQSGLRFGLMLGLTLAMLITFLKYSNASLSLGTLLGVILATALTSLIAWKIVSQKDEDLLEIGYSKYLNLSFVLIMLTIFTSTIIKGIPMFYDFMGVMLLYGIILAFMSFLGFRTFNYLTIRKK